MTMGNLESTINPTHMFLGCGRTLEFLEKHNSWTTCRVHTERKHLLRSEPGPFLLWGTSVTHQATVLTAWCFVQKPLLLMTAARCLLYGGTSSMDCYGVVLVHSSTQTVFKSWRFRELLPWTLVFSFSIYFKFGSSQVIGRTIVAAL